MTVTFFHKFCLIAVIAFFLSSNIAYSTNSEPQPNSGYKTHDILGWQVMVSNAVSQDKILNQKILLQVTQDLTSIVNTVPQWSLEYLRETPLWFEKSMPPPFGNNLFFNGSKKGSAKHGIQHLYGGVVAGSTEAYLAVSGIHPWQLLHELTHAYHQFVTKHSYRPILQAYQNAIDKDLHTSGNQYARKNHKEYFSTLTEAYFGHDANYPHNITELAKHDPIGYCAVVKAWGLVGEQASSAPLSCQ
ncbi:MAG: hypothetical protein ACRBEE_10150 [Arenicella sp.]